MRLITMLTAAVCLANIPTAAFPAVGQEYGEIEVIYEEDGSPVCGAGFTFFKVGTICFSMEDGIVSDKINMIVEGLSEDVIYGDAGPYLELVQSAYDEATIVQGAVYTGVTDEDGLLNICNVEQGIYLAAETSPAENHVSSGAFFFQLPCREAHSWNYDIRILPKSVPAGALQIEKQVLGEKGEYDREFHITVQLDDAEQHKYTYRKSDGSSGLCSSGETFLLKNSESVLITGIPDGTGYSVTEKEADQDGYITYISANTGHIERYETIPVIVKNIRSTIPLTSDEENLRFYTMALVLNVFFAVILLSILRITSGR